MLAAALWSAEELAWLEPQAASPRLRARTSRSAVSFFMVLHCVLSFLRLQFILPETEPPAVVS